MLEESHKNAEIRKYLLGDITFENERENIEERLMIDDAYFQELLIQESELIQDYVDDQLTGEEKKSFENDFLISEERQYKVKFARALRNYVDAEKNSDKTEINKKEREKGFVSFFRSFLSSPLPVTLTALILVGVISWFAWSRINNTEDKEILASLNKAYEKERPFEARISGFNYAPINNLRGGSAKDNVNSLQRNSAELLSQQFDEKNPTAENLHSLGRVYLAKKSLDEAIKQLEKSEQLAPQNVEVVNDLGVAYLEKSKTFSPEDGKRFEFSAKALENFEKAIKSNPKSLEALFNRAICLQNITSPQQAQEAWQQYLSLDTSSQWAEEARRNLQKLEVNKSQALSKEEILQKFLTAYEQSDHEKAWQTLSRNREMITGKLIGQQLTGLFLKSTGTEKDKYLSALKYVGKLEKEKSGDPYFSDIANFYSNVSSEKLNDLSKAQDEIQKGYDFCQKTKENEAIANFINARQLFEKAGDIWESEFADYWIAFCEFQTNSNSTSSKRLENLIEYSQPKNYKWLSSNSFSRLAINIGFAGNYSKSLEYYKKALSLSEETEDLYLNQKVFSQLADRYQELGQYDEALNYLQKSLCLFDFAETSNRQKWRTYDYAVRLLAAKKLYAAAANFSKEAIALNAAEIKDESFTYYNYAQLSRIYGEQKDFDKALDFARQSVASAQNIPAEKQSNKYQAVAFSNLAYLQRHNNNCDEGVKNYERAIDLYSSMEPSINYYAARKGRLFCYVEKNDVQAVETDLPQVLEIYEAQRTKILEEQNRNTFFDNEQSVYDLAINYEFNKNDNEKAFNYAEESTARSLLDLQKNGAKISFEKDTPQIVFDNKISKPLKLDEIRAQMPDEVQIIEYSVLRDRVLIWLVTKNDFQSFHTEIKAEDLEKKVAEFLEAIKNNESEKQNILSRELYKILIKPLEKSLSCDRQIGLIPDKFLSGLPFIALISDETNNYFVADYKSFLAPSSNVFIVSSENARKRISSEPEKLLSVGNPLFDQQEFSALPLLSSAKEEAEEIGAFYQNSKLLLEKNATKENLKNSLPQIDVFHFAGHYVTDEHSPLLSKFLITGSGKESSLYNYELLEQQIKKPKLIVLSACQTGVERYYKGEGMVGAGRVFLASGIPLIVASQWQVDSDATEELMRKFHYYRTKGKLSTVSALQQAQLDMLNSQNEKFRSPFYWSGFTIFGGYAQF